MASKATWNENHFKIDPMTENQLRKVYPFFELEIQKMCLWYLANPKKRKKNHFRFITNWLSRVSKERGILKPSRDYRKDNLEFEEKLKTYETAPPPPSWTELKERLKR